MQIIVQGLASGKHTPLAIDDSELDETLLFWLRKKGITVASSCDGEGVCKKCVIQNDWLSCMMTVREFLAQEPDGKIQITYL